MVYEKSLRRRRDHHARGGLTLLELVVVMAILIALAGILVPVFPDLLARASTSTGATNLTEVAKAVQMYQGLYRSYPDLLDSLVDGTAPCSPRQTPAGISPTQQRQPCRPQHQRMTTRRSMRPDWQTSARCPHKPTAQQQPGPPPSGPMLRIFHSLHSPSTPQIRSLIFPRRLPRRSSGSWARRVRP